MRLTPLDIRKQEFLRGFRGFDAEEVNAFLQMVANQWEELQDENRRREERIRELENKLTHYERVEEALQEALQTARESSRKTLENAEEKASMIIEKAESRAEDITREAEKNRHELKRETVKLSGRRSEIVTRLRAFLMSEMELLARYEGDDPVGFIKLLPAEERKLRRLSERLEEEDEARPDDARPDDVRDEDRDAVHGWDTGSATEAEPRDESLLDEDVAGPEHDLEADNGRGSGANSDDEMSLEQEGGVPPIESSSAGDSDWSSRSVHGEEPADSDQTAGQRLSSERTDQRRDTLPSDSDTSPDERGDAGRGWTAETVVSRASGDAPSADEPSPPRDDADEESDSSRASSEEIEKIRRILSDLD
ncbi:MAG: DivIVA domain-containing protein [Rhodothermales bacterium]